MTSTQKQAWFNLAVIAVCLLTVLVLALTLGLRRAQGGVGILGLMGLSYFFVRKRPGAVVTDERDAWIRLRSLMIASLIAWVAFVLVCTFLAPALYGDHGAVPVEVVQMSVWIGFILVAAVDAIATLVQYGGEEPDAS